MDRTPEIEQLRGVIMPHLLSFEKKLVDIKSGIKRETPKKVLCFDPGKTHLAVVFLDLEFNSFLSTRVTPPEGVKTMGAYVLYNELVAQKWIEDFQPDVIFCEQVAHGSQFGVADAGRIQYALERIAISAQIPIFKIVNGTMRKYLNARDEPGKKSRVILRVKEKYGVEFPTEDETDAYALARTGIALYTGEIKTS